VPGPSRARVPLHLPGFLFASKSGRLAQIQTAAAEAAVTGAVDATTEQGRVTPATRDF
jgi:hypothetical protein